MDIYLDNLVAQINTPFLERLGVTLYFDIVFTLVNLTEYIHRTEGFGLDVSLLESFSARAVPPCITNKGVLTRSVFV